MKYDLSQKYKDHNSELFLNGYMSKEKYFDLEDKLNEMKELFIINLN